MASDRVGVCRVCGACGPIYHRTRMHAAPFPTSLLDYELAPERVAREPVTPRDAARMMVVHREAQRVEHRHARDLPEYLRPSDLLVVNRTHVMAARFKLRRESDGREFEGLLESPLGERRWKAFVRQARRLVAGDRLALIPPANSAVVPIEGAMAPDSATVTVHGRADEGVDLGFDGTVPVESIIAAYGWTPVPPYIRRARERSQVVDGPETDRLDRDRYQTVYARSDAHESIAAPTAGLHFTPELLAAIERLGVRRVELSLQVGAGTFKPVESEFLDQHPIHSEHFEVPPATLEALREVDQRRRTGESRVVAVGTTCVRALESLPDPLPDDHGWSAEASLLILPDTPIRRVDVLLTNFHLPRSSLLSLVAAFVGIERLHELYALAQREGYRFFSYGDAMLIL